MTTRWTARVEPPWDFDAWRTLARAALRADVAPDAIDWTGGEQSSLVLGRDLAEAPRVATHDASVPSTFLPLAATVLCHRDDARFALLYRVLWRIAHGENHLLSIATDADVVRVRALALAVRRDSHKMKAFVRFREVPGSTDDFVAWFEPAHFIVDRVAPFFARRFAGMRWAILTPYRSVAWNGEALAFGAGANRSDAPADDAGEDLWRTYYAHIFNPARLNERHMRQEMPQKYWKNLPEAKILSPLIRDAHARTAEMREREPEPVRRRVPAPIVDIAPAAMAGSIEALRDAARDCRACPLWQPATQTVFGEGPSSASIVLVGEQPGDREDLVGRPFVGPAGQLLDDALVDAGLSRDTLYVTNAVKHFRFEQRGKMRLHKNPDRMHIDACSMWLSRELSLLRPRIVVCLGANAASIVLGRDFRLMRERGTWRAIADDTRAIATVHPSWILRQRGGVERDAAYGGFVADLRLVAEAAAA
jgi:DNA polymerase